MTYPVTQARPTFYFLGVSTGRSAGQRVFPRWADYLGLDAQLIGIDLPLNADPAEYRAFVTQIKADPLSRGALITSHKINLLAAAADLFDEFTAEAQLCGEVSCIYKRGGKLIGHVVEIDSFAITLQSWLGVDYFAGRYKNVLCLGAGGSASALLAYFGTRAESARRPLAITLVDRDPERLAHKEPLIAQLARPNSAIHLVESQGTEFVDRLIGSQPAGSLIINATGMGKDLPGSPVSDAAVWPLEAAVWDLNYRGERHFLRQARWQQDERRLKVGDGWLLFCGGWATSIGRVFALADWPSQFLSLVAIAAAVRPDG